MEVIKKKRVGGCRGRGRGSGEGRGGRGVAEVVAKVGVAGVVAEVVRVVTKAVMRIGEAVAMGGVVRGRNVVNRYG